MNRLWYQTPAAEWEGALAIGSGRLGAMLSGEQTENCSRSIKRACGTAEQLIG